MTEPHRADAIDSIVEDLGAWDPTVDLTGLRITGRILRLAEHLDAARAEVLRSFDLTTADFDMLATLRRRTTREPLKIRDLQRSLMLSSGGTTKRLDRLEAAGLIERHADPNDRRGTLIALTGAGRALIDRAMPAVLGREADTVSRVIGSARERSTVESSLRKLLVVHEAADQQPGTEV